MQKLLEKLKKVKIYKNYIKFLMCQIHSRVCAVILMVMKSEGAQDITTDLFHQKLPQLSAFCARDPFCVRPNDRSTVCWIIRGSCLCARGTSPPFTWDYTYIILPGWKGKNDREMWEQHSRWGIYCWTSSALVLQFYLAPTYILVDQAHQQQHGYTSSAACGLSNKIAWLLQSHKIAFTIFWKVQFDMRQLFVAARWRIVVEFCGGNWNKK